MTIKNRDELINSMGNNNTRFVLDKANLAGQTAGTFVSLWRASGQPGAGAIPAAAAACNNTTLGGMPFAQQTAPATSYVGYYEIATGNVSMTVELHDRLAHMGGLNGTVTAAQTVGLDLSTLGATDNIDARKGDDDFSDVQWWLEWYTATGSTATNATLNVTYNDGSTGNLTAVALAATRPIGFMQSLNVYVPAAQSGKFIRAVNTVTLSASTGTAGSFGITATRIRASQGCPINNFKFCSDWAQLGLPEVRNASCVFPIVLTSTTSSGTVRGGGKFIHG